MKLVILLSALVAACGSPGPDLDLPAPRDLDDDLDPIIEAFRREHRVPGISVVILRGDDLLFAQGYGLADLRTGRPATPATRYAIASISKHFTAVAVMLLVESGAVDLDAPITEYVPSYEPAGDVPLVRHLLAQTSGVAEFDGLPGIEALENASAGEVTLLDLIDFFEGAPARFEPGERWAYSNSNYSLLAALVESVTGEAHDDFLARKLLAPLDLDGTGSWHAMLDEPRRAVGYDTGSGAPRPRPAASNRAVYTGNGGLGSTALDMARWMRALTSGQVLTADSYTALTTPEPVGVGYTPPYGFGLSLVPMAERPCISHTGVSAGFTSMVAAFPEDDLVIAVVANRRHLWITELLQPLAREVLELPHPTRQNLPLPEGVAELCVGVFEDGLFTLRFEVTGAGLSLHVEELGPPMRLRYQGAHHFVAAEHPDTFEVWFDVFDGRADRVAFQWLEVRSFGERVE